MKIFLEKIIFQIKHDTLYYKENILFMQLLHSFKVCFVCFFFTSDKVLLTFHARAPIFFPITFLGIEQTKRRVNP